MLLNLIALAATLQFIGAKDSKDDFGDQMEFGRMQSAENDEVAFNLIGGADADIQRFPFYAMVVKKEVAVKTFRTGAKLKLFCGSSLIHPKFVITAYHCFKKRPYPNLWVVVFHVVDRCHPVGFRGVQISNLFFHPSSMTSAKAKINDLAIAELKYPVTDITPVSLPNHPPVVGREGMLIGFGRMELKKKKTDAEVPCILQKTGQMIELPARCRHEHEQVIHDFCTRSLWRPDSLACRGDSGGPWLVSGANGYELQGLSSFGAADCKIDSQNDHYTSVYVFVPWINHVITAATNGTSIIKQTAY